MDNIIATETKKTIFSSFPKPIRIIFKILATVTLIYFILEGLRIVLHFITEKKTYYTIILSIILAAIVVLLILEYFTPYEPLTDIWNKILDFFMIL